VKKLRATGTLALVAVLLVLGTLAWVGRAAAAESSGATVSTFKVEGMTCGGCEAGVKMKVKKLDGVESVEASYKAATARVVYDPAKVTPERIIAAIEELGYKAELQETMRP
jgi:copper chaperone CopZ